MQVLFIGDVVGGPGRRGSRQRCRSCASATRPDLVIVNGENSAGGMGITEKTANDLFDAGADVITTGNHVYRHREVYGYLDRERAADPAGQLPPRQPRQGPHGGRDRRDAVWRDQPQRRRRPAGRALALSRGRRDPRRRSRPTSSSSTSTPRSPARRSRWAGTSTAASPPSSAPTPTCPPPTRGCSPGHRLHLRRRHDRARGPACSGSSRSRSLQQLITQMPVRFETAEEDVWVMGAVVEVNDTRAG